MATQRRAVGLRQKRPLRLAYHRRPWAAVEVAQRPHDGRSRPLWIYFHRPLQKPPGELGVRTLLPRDLLQHHAGHRLGADRCATRRHVSVEAFELAAVADTLIDQRREGV